METKMKGIYVLMDFMLVVIFGFTMADLLVILTGEQFNLLTIDNGIKLLLTFAGLIYLVLVKIVGEYKMGKLNRKIKREQLEKLEYENEEAKNGADNG